MKEHLSLSDAAALSKVQEGCTIIDAIKENINMGSFHIIETNTQPKVFAEVSPKKSIRRFVEISIRLRSYI